MLKENEKRVLDLLHSLPKDKQVEVLDFIEFLWQKSLAKSNKNVSSASETVGLARERIIRKAKEIKLQGGPKIDDLIAELGGPRKPAEGWNSTDFIRQDRDSR